MNLLKTSFLSGIVTAFKILAGLVTTKIMAIFVGPSGVAIVANFNNMATIFTTFANGGISSGVTKYIAEYDEDKKRKDVIKYSMFINMICSLVLGFFIVIFSNKISVGLLKDIEYRLPVIMLGITIIFYGFNATFYAILNGYKNIKYLLLTGFIGSVISVILAVVITIKFGLFGALINAMIAQILIFILNMWFNKKLSLITFKGITKNIELRLISKLAKYSVMNIISAFVVPVSILILRNYIYSNFSSDEAGYIQGIWSISGAYLMLVTTTLQIYYLPTLSGINDKLELKKEIVNGYKTLLPITILGGLLIYFFRYFIIHVMYTNEFYPMAKYFLFQVIGDTVKIASWILSFTLVAKAMIKWFIISEVLFSLIYVVLGILFMKNFGSVGITYAYTLNYLLYLIFLIVIIKKELFSQN